MEFQCFVGVNDCWNMGPPLMFQKLKVALTMQPIHFNGIHEPLGHVTVVSLTMLANGVFFSGFLISTECYPRWAGVWAWLQTAWQHPFIFFLVFLLLLRSRT